ncbi:hypothetical protein GIB67_038026 [Kingdonia uniflora]|uniref:Phosphatidic acid phosphatase type 2/haloperoxidase domain-containing protein n=1 Tax=Kingdonia uniflora TaxID=39325 RepID=A0A7J7MBY4_9MAGN|nr:hypothetical protein GIB67_038026 [Kingdonia uniflora]
MKHQEEPVLVKSPAKSPSILNCLISLDTTCSLHIHTIFTPIPRSILKTLEISGDGRFWFPIPIAIYFTLTNSTNLHSILIGLVIGFLLDLVLVGLIKFLIRRPRPVYNKGMHLTVAVDHWSFPSGHSSRVCFIASYLCLSKRVIKEAAVELGYGDDDGKFVIFFVLIVCFWSVITSISRVLLGRHFVLDVFAGACLGVFNALLVFKLLKF